MPIHLGIIGLSADPHAWATAAHLRGLQSAPLNKLYELVAIGGSSEESALAAAKAHGVSSEKAYATPEAMAADADVDMVVVSVKVSRVF